MLASQIGDRDGIFAGEPVICRQDDDPRLAEQRLDRQAVLVGGQPQVPDVDPAIADEVGLVGPVGAEYLHGQVRVAAA